MTKKVYRAESGIALDSTFAHHSTSCEECQRFDAKKPATIALMCLEGSVLWKRENGVTIKREQEERSQSWASKADVKRAMRYKGDQS